MALEMKEGGDRFMNGQKLLDLSGRFEPLHDPFSFSDRKVGILGSVVQTLVLAVLDPRHDLSLRCAIALQLVGDQHPRRAALLLQELSHQALGCLLVTPALDQNVEDDAMLIDRPPKPIFLTLDRDHQFIKVPLVTSFGPSTTQGFRKQPTELQRPLPYSFMTDHDTTGCQHFIHHPKAERKTEIEPHNVSDDPNGNR